MTGLSANRVADHLARRSREQMGQSLSNVTAIFDYPSATSERLR